MLHSYLESNLLHLEVLECFPCQYNLKKTLMHFINAHKSLFIDLIPGNHNFPGLPSKCPGRMQEAEMRCQAQPPPRRDLVPYISHRAFEEF